MSSFSAGRPRKKKKNVQNATNFDIKIRNFVYSGVPSESQNSLHHKAIIKRKELRDKVEKEEQLKGCSKFMYRNVKALQFEKEQMNRGGEAGEYAFSSMGETTRPRSLALESYMSASDGLLQTGVIQNFYQDKKRVGSPSKEANAYDQDPNKHLYLAAALGSLGLKNERTNNANGNIVEMLEPNVH